MGISQVVGNTAVFGKVSGKYCCFQGPCQVVLFNGDHYNNPIKCACF